MKDRANTAAAAGRESSRFDVVIIGSGFEGGVLGTILARHGYEVLILDASSHPRFALGESTVRHTWRMLKIMAERYDIPEFRQKFSSGDAVHRHVTSSCGVKTNFGFLYHREGEHQRPEESSQVVIPSFPEGYEAHLYRQDIDSFLASTAAHYGAKLRFNCAVTHVEVQDRGITVQTSKGDTITARYVADASGTASLLSRLWRLRDDPPRLRTNSRCLFTHMIDVTPYDELDLPHGVPRMVEKWYSGTCHHLFDGGWLWVIPFGNRKGSTNHLCSIGLSLDNERFPRPEDKGAEEEWNEFLRRFPSIREQFKQAKAVREWAATPRLQKSLSRVTGDRWVVLSAANGSGFLDAIFSRGLANATEMIHALVSRLMSALDDDDLRAERFEYIERLTNAHLARNDQLAYGSYVSFKDFDLWNAWFRLWAVGVALGDLRLAHGYHEYLATRNESVLPDAQEPLGLFASNHAAFGELFDESFDEILRFARGTQTVKETSDAIFRRLGAIDFVSPALRIAEPSHRCLDIRAPSVAVRTFLWALTQAPPDIRTMTLAAMRVLLPDSMQSWRLSLPKRSPATS